MPYDVHAHHPVTGSQRIVRLSPNSLSYALIIDDDEHDDADLDAAIRTLHDAGLIASDQG
jgi:hypothetical protein